MARKKLTLHDFYQMKKESRKITRLTSCHFPTVQFAEAALIISIKIDRHFGARRMHLQALRLSNVISGGTLSRMGVNVVPIPRLTYICEASNRNNPSG